jgi:HlyD family secretion protein
MTYSLSFDKMLAGCLVLGLFFPFSVANSAEEEPASASDTVPKSTKISGVFEAIHAHEISASTEQLETFEISRIVAHGTSVRKGQNLVWFETEDIDKKVKNAEIDLRLAKLALEDEEFAYKQFLETQTLDREAAEQARSYAKQDYDNFIQVDREREILGAEFNLKMSRYSLEGVMEELAQLEQMYNEDDLTEASEEIVLKRAKQAVESTQFRLEGTEIASNRTVKQTVPRSEAQNKEKLAKAELAYSKAIRDLNSNQLRREIELNRKRDSFKEQDEKLAELKEERKKVVLTSPIDGIVFHGQLMRGKLGEKPSELKPASKVTSQQVVVTVVDPSKLQIRVDLDEKNLPNVSVRGKCKVTVPALADFETTGIVKSVSSVPYAGTKYDCVVTFSKKKDQPAILPTMTCELEFVEEDATEKDSVEKKETQDDESKEEK